MGPGQDISTERYYHGIDMIAMLFFILRRAYWIVLAAVIGAAAARYYAAHFVTPLYQATSKLYIAGSDSTISEKDLWLGSYLAKDFQEAVKTWRVYELANERLNLNYSYESLTGMVSTRNPSGSHLLYITVTSPKAEEAQQVADTYAEAIQEYIETVMNVKRPQLLEKARKPSVPVSPNVKRSTRNGATVGALVPAILLVILFLLDDRIRSEDDIANAVQLPILGTIPFQSRKNNNRNTKTPAVSSPTKAPQAIIVGAFSIDSAGIESVDTICTNIFFAGNKLKTILITSCRENEGKSFTALQVSLSMARRGKKTLLIDGDLRKSVMRSENLVRLSGKGTGLVHLLSGQCELSDVVYATNVPGLYLLPDGESVKTPLTLISSPAFPRLLKELKKSFDMIIIDTSPIGSVVDAAEIARQCDGSLIVIENKATRKKMLMEVVDCLQKTKTPILGCVLNKCPQSRKKSKRRANIMVDNLKRRGI